MSELRIRPGVPEDLPTLLKLSAAWAAENITYGYFANSEKEFQGYRVWVAELEGAVVGYAAGQLETAERASSIHREGQQWFELEELYVEKAQRKAGIGAQLLRRVEADLRREGVSQLMLTAANREHEGLLSLYIREGVKVYSLRMFKDL